MNWRELIGDEMDKYNDAWCNEIGIAGDIDAELPTDATYGKEEPQLDAIHTYPFTLWTVQRVYFLVEYRGSLYVDSVPVKPQPEPIGFPA